MAEQKRGGPRGHGPQGHGFQRPKDFRGTVSKLLRYIGRYKASLVVVFICLVISSVGSVMSSYLLKPIINDYILVGDFAGLLKMLALLLGLFLLSGLCSYAYAASWCISPSGRWPKCGRICSTNCRTCPCGTSTPTSPAT